MADIPASDFFSFVIILIIFLLILICYNIYTFEKSPRDDSKSGGNEDIKKFGEKIEAFQKSVNESHAKFDAELAGFKTIHEEISKFGNQMENFQKSVNESHAKFDLELGGFKVIQEKISKFEEKIVSFQLIVNESHEKFEAGLSEFKNSSQQKLDMIIDILHKNKESEKADSPEPDQINLEDILKDLQARVEKIEAAELKPVPVIPNEDIEIPQSEAGEDEVPEPEEVPPEQEAEIPKPEPVPEEVKEPEADDTKAEPEDIQDVEPVPPEPESADIETPDVETVDVPDIVEPEQN